jgi:hypothetical protein
VFRCIPFSTLVTPATLGVASKLHLKLHNISVGQPFISNPDSFLSSRAYTGGSLQAEGKPTNALSRLFNIILSSGEILYPGAPNGLQNASYAVDLVLPIIHCRPSNDTVRALTAEAVFAKVIGPILNLKSVAQNVHNLTWSASLQTNLSGADQSTEGALQNGSSEADEITSLSGYIGYFGMNANATDNINIFPGEYHLDSSTDLWMAMAHPPPGYLGDAEVAKSIQYEVSYSTCSLQNASISTNITFINNVPSIYTGPPRFLDFSPNGSTVSCGLMLCGMSAYEVFAKSIFAPLIGSVDIINGIDPLNTNYTETIWNTSIDRTIYGDAMDFLAVQNMWEEPLKDWPQGNTTMTPQSKNLTAFIEQISLNASLSLMSNPVFK